jgi:hypothetical protein
MATNLVPPARADDDPTTGERVLGTFLGSIDGALIARAATIRNERTPALALIYAGAVGGGAALGYALAGDEDAMTAMGILLIPLAVLNWVLPPPSHQLDAATDVSGFDRMRACSAGAARPQRLEQAYETAAGPGWWESALLNLLPRPATGGIKVAPLQARF